MTRKKVNQETLIDVKTDAVGEIADKYLKVREEINTAKNHLNEIELELVAEMQKVGRTFIKLYGCTLSVKTTLAKVGISVKEQ